MTRDGTVQVAGLRAGNVMLESIPVSNRQLAPTVLMEHILVARRLQDVPIVPQARLPTLSVKLVTVLVVIVVKDNTLQRAVDFALTVMLESGQTQRQLLLVRHAIIVRQTLIQMQGV